ncbi:uncharacterized protein RAG0_10362 [Rhynchosporium agropyri]|uniref:Uncharacterized protein n=1 Tax=Rhynchosporium agropyri TaxID=914238 RepID=A0A1E1KZJ0_9HELO|nr:uncharacterized protein RAG0_10362 [Rhynchosporium agropyri]
MSVMEGPEATRSITSNTASTAPQQIEPKKHNTEPTHIHSMTSERNENVILKRGPNVKQSYYADKDLAWWLQLARDFKNARQVPLPDEEGEDLQACR